MQGFSEANRQNYFPQETANQIASAYSRMGGAQAEIEYKREEEERRKKEEKKRKIVMGVILGAAALATGGAALAAAPAAAGVAGGAAAAGGAAGAGAAGAAGTAAAAGAGTAAATGAGAAGAASSGGFLAGLGTFGKGALSAFTGAPTAATGAGGFAGGLNAAGGMLGQIGTSMLTSGGGGMSGSGMSRGGSGGNMDVGDAAMGALGSYMQEVQGANKSSRVMEGMLKDPAARSALFPGIDQNQTDAILKYKDTLGAIDGARFLQTAMPLLSKTATGNVEFDRQMQLQSRRNEADYAKGMAGMIMSKPKASGAAAPVIPRGSYGAVDFTLPGGLPDYSSGGVDEWQPDAFHPVRPVR
jgi:hypothetical protein